MTIFETNKTLRKLLAPLLVASLLATLLASSPGPARAADAAPPSLPTFNIPALSQAHIESPLPNVIVVATGGTLAGKASNSTSFQSYSAGTYTMEKLLGDLPVHKTADVSSYQFGNKGSGGYTMQELYDLSLAVDAALEIYDSAVVTTGTDTMEEIAYFLDLTVRSPKPVVVTGAMRPWDVIGTDGPANLYQAIKVAGSNKTQWFGTVVMLNDVIHTAREVTKSNSHRMDTFETPMFGAIGYVDDPAVRIYRLTARAMKAGQSDWATPFDLRTIAKTALPVVEIVYNYQEAGGGAIRALVQDGAKGIVTAGTGAGGISSKMSAARSAAIQDHGVVFASTTRTGSGSTSGSSNGIVAADNLNPQHARIMLMLSLAFSSDFNTIKNWFETVGTQDITSALEQAPIWADGSALTLESRSTTDIIFAWPLALDDERINGYSVYVTGKDVPIARLSATTTSYSASGLLPGTSYSYTVKAIDNSGLESAPLTGTFATDSVLLPGGPTTPITKTEGMIQPANGGSLSLGQLITLNVPKGATEGETKMSIEKLLNSTVPGSQPGVLATSVYELLKDRSGNFLVPVTLTFKFDPSLVKEGQKASIFYFDEELKQWVEIGGTVEGDTITAQTDHFTKFAVFVVDNETAPEPEISFTDIVGHWSEEAIKEAAAAGIVQGYDDGTFKPEKTVTRAEFAVMLMNALQAEESGAPLAFTDNSAIGSWARTAIAQALQLGIVGGYPDGSFRPGATINRAEMASMIAKAISLPTSGTAATSFADNAAIPSWALGAVKSAADEGILHGRSGNRFVPQGTATRAEAVTAILNMLKSDK